MTNHKSILVLGGDGMAGHMIKTYFQEKEYDVSWTTRAENSRAEYYDVVEDFKHVESIIRSVRPACVINCIGVLNQFAEENVSTAILVNAFLPHYLDGLSKTFPFKLVHISTDCVFSGSKGDYTEKDKPDAESFYGKTKALGEIDNEKNVTLRTSIVGPDQNTNGIGLFQWFMKQKGSIKGFSQVFWSGVTTLQLAKSVEEAFLTNAHGLYHLTNNSRISKYALLSLFKHYAKKDIDIQEDASYSSDKSLRSTRADASFSVPDYETMVREMFEWMRAHKDMYAEYKL